MSVMQLYSLRDNVAGNFFPPFPARSHEHASRGFGDALSNRENPLFAQYPHHFDLYHVGFMDEDTGVISSHDPRLVIAGQLVARNRGLTIPVDGPELALPVDADVRQLAHEVLSSRNQEL